MAPPEPNLECETATGKGVCVCVCVIGNIITKKLPVQVCNLLWHLATPACGGRSDEVQTWAAGMSNKQGKGDSDEATRDAVAAALPAKGETLQARGVVTTDFERKQTFANT